MMYEIIALAWSVVSLIACVIGVVTPYWTYASKAGASAARGLWYNCDTGDSAAYCFSKLSSVPDYLHVVRAMELSGILLVGVCVGCGILKLILKQQDMLPKIAGVFVTAAGILMLIGTIVFAVNNVESSNSIVDFQFKLSAGFGLCTVAGVHALAAGVWYLIICCRHKVIELVL